MPKSQSTATPPKPNFNDDILQSGVHEKPESKIVSSKRQGWGNKAGDTNNTSTQQTAGLNKLIDTRPTVQIQ